MKTDQELLAELRAAHGEVEVLRLDGGVLVVIRKPTLQEYLDAADVIARQAGGEIFRDPNEMSRPLLALVVAGLEEAKAELELFPGFDLDLAKAVLRLSGGTDSVQFDEDPTAVTLAAKAVSSRALAFRCDGDVVCCRPLDRFDWARCQAALANARGTLDSSWMSPKVLARIAEQQVIETKDAAGRKPAFDELCAKWPMVSQLLGLQLYLRATSKAKRIEGK